MADEAAFGVYWDSESGRERGSICWEDEGIGVSNKKHWPTTVDRRDPGKVRKGYWDLIMEDLGFPEGSEIVGVMNPRCSSGCTRPTGIVFRLPGGKMRGCVTEHGLLGIHSIRFEEVGREYLRNGIRLLRCEFSFRCMGGGEHTYWTWEKVGARGAQGLVIP